MIKDRIIRQLDSIDWDFPASIPGLTYVPHWYPGTFPTQLPSTFIQALSSPGDLVFDPYGGSGATASEGIRLGRKVWVADINPVGALSTITYCSLLLLKLLEPKKFELFFNVIEDIIGNRLSEKPESTAFDFGDSDSASLELDVFFDKYFRPKINDFLDAVRVGSTETDELNEWMHKDTIAELESILNFLEKERYSGSRNFIRLFFETAVSSNLRALSSQIKSWGHIADNVYPKELIYKDVKKQLRTWAARLKQNILRVTFKDQDKISGVRLWFSLHDWRSDSAIRNRPRISPNLIVTSPPYGDAIDYINSQKLSLYFLGHDGKSVHEFCSREIGARRKRFKSTSRVDWANEISEAAARQCELLGNGLFVVILPHKNHGREIGIEKIRNTLEIIGWNRVYEVDRSISQKRTRQSWTSIKMETITIFGKA